MNTVIFIYGFTGSTKHARVAKKVFSKSKFLIFEYNSKLKDSIEKISSDLDKFIEKNTKKSDKIYLIGVSAGGIIAEYYSKILNPKKIQALSTICSPINGTYVTRFYSKKLKGLKDLSRNSKILSKIKSSKSKVKEINFYSYFDPLVPGNSGKGKNPEKIGNFFHFTIQYNKKTLIKSKDFFGI